MCFIKKFNLVYNFINYCVFTGTSYQDLGVCENSEQWRNSQDSSGSEQPECVDDEQLIRSTDSKPRFTLGEDICDVKSSQQSNQSSDIVLKPQNPDENQSTSEQVVSMKPIFVSIQILYFKNIVTARS